jgi:hypothetical protein
VINYILVRFTHMDTVSGTHYVYISLTSWDSLGGIVTDYRLDDRGSNPGGGWEFFFSTPRPDRFWSLPSFLSNGYEGLFPWGRREADHSPPSSAGVKE